MRSVQLPIDAFLLEILREPSIALMKVYGHQGLKDSIVAPEQGLSLAKVHQRSEWKYGETA